jgi:WD40 repeat protein
VVALLVRARLVTTHEETAELAHEALARAWPRLTNWLEEDVAGQRILRHLAGAAEGWDSLGRPASELYRGPRLDAALDWREATRPDLTDVEADFLDASQAQLASEQEAMAERARHQARQNRRLRSSLVGVAVLLVVALVAGLLAFSSGNEARDQRDAARAAQRDTQVEALVNRSLALRQSDRAVAALLAVEAYRRDPDARAWSALLGTFTATPGFMRYEHLPADGFLHGALVPGTTTAIVALDGGDLVAWDTRDGTIDRRFPPTDWDVGYAVVRVSEDGRVVTHTIISEEACPILAEVVEKTDGAGCFTTFAYEVATGRRIMGPTILPFGPDTAVNADGSLVAVSGGWTGKAALYRTVDGELLGTFAGLERPAESVLYRDTAAVAFGPDGRLYLGSMAGPIRVVDPASLEIVDTYDTPPFSSHNHLTVTPEGLLVGGGDHALVAVDTATGRQRWAVDIRSVTNPEQCPWMAVAPTVERLYCGGYFGLMEERNLATGDRTGVRFDPQLGSVGDLVVSADGRELLAFAVQAPVVSRWRLDGSGPLTRLAGEGYAAVDGYDPSGDVLLVANHDDLTGTGYVDPGVWDPKADEIVKPLGADVTGALWITSDIVGVRFGDGRLGTVDRRRDRPAQVSPDVESEGFYRAWPSADGTRTYLAYKSPGSAAERAELRAYEHGEPVEPTIEVAGHITSLSTTTDGSRLVLTTDFNVMTVHDARTGERVGGPIENTRTASVGAGDVLVAANPTGDVLEYDLDTLEPVGAFPGARGDVESLQFSDDGQVLAATSDDLTLSLYDVATRSRLGDPLPTAAPSGIFEGWLHPDGTSVAINSRLGIALWDVGPEHLAEAACRLAGRNLTRAEWATYLADLGGYRATCPDQPPPPGT